MSDRDSTLGASDFAPGSETVDALRSRLEICERGLKRARIGNVCAIVLAGLALASTFVLAQVAVDPAIIRTRQLWIFDDKKQVGMGLTAFGLTIFKPEESDYQSVTLTRDGLEFLSDDAEKGHPVTQVRRGSILLYDEQGSALLDTQRLGISKENGPSLTLGSVELVNEKNETQTTLPSSLAFFDSKGKMRLELPPR